MKKTVIIFLICTSLFSIYFQFNNLVSFYWQVPLTQDWSNSELIIPIDVIEKINFDHPNLTNAALPLSSMKMRYYIREGKFDKLNSLLESSMKANPFLGVEQNIYAQYLYNSGKYDSAYKYSLLSFNKLSNNQLHGSVLISTLIKLDSLSKAMDVFESIKYKDKAHYSLLLMSLVEARDSIYLKKYLDESRHLIGENEDFKKFEMMQKVGYEKYFLADGYNQMAKIDFDKGYFNESLDKYRKSINLNPLNSNSYLNLGKILFKHFDDSTIIAKKMFKKTIDIDNDNGEALYYLGVTEYILDKIDKDSICKIFNKSLKLGYKDSKPFIKKYGCIL